MRVFIAIDFTPEIKNHLNDMVQDLKEECVTGRFTRSENMHLTLAFLGEVPFERIQDIVEVMKQVVLHQTAFEIEIGGLGKFIRQGEALYWCGIKENVALAKLQHELVTKLKAKDVWVDEKPFKPHITLARRCTVKNTMNEEAFSANIVPMLMKVTQISLMESKQIEGKLTYRSLEEVRLQD